MRKVTGLRGVSLDSGIARYGLEGIFFCIALLHEPYTGQGMYRNAIFYLIS